VENWEELTQKLAKPLSEARIWLLTKTASQPYTVATFKKGDVLVFGSESAGLPPELLTQFADKALRIPMRREVRSLNLSAAAAAVIYEALRQLRPEIA
jgi:tRNA (cytidine/uridine-2'-O-)-methyltransferase